MWKSHQHCKLECVHNGPSVSPGTQHILSTLFLILLPRVTLLRTSNKPSWADFSHLKPFSHAFHVCLPLEATTKASSWDQTLAAHLCSYITFSATTAICEGGTKMPSLHPSDFLLPSLSWTTAMASFLASLLLFNCSPIVHTTGRVIFGLVLFSFIFILCLWVLCLHMYIYTTWMPGAHRGLKRTSDLELESWIIVYYMVLWDIWSHCHTLRLC